MPILPTKFEDVINEASTAVYSTQLTDQDGTNILLAAIDSLTITLCTVIGGTIINSRNDQNALNANGVTVSSSGLLTYVIEAADGAIIDLSLATDAVEVHRATFKLNFNTVSFSNWDVDFNFRNLKSAP